jgi:4'-phosphopantetheinyl transferase
VLSSLLWPVARVYDSIPLIGVHVWAWSLVRPSFDLAADSRLLSPSEIDKLNKFRFEIDRARYSISHATLRRILSAYVGCPPQELQFSTGVYGKPRLLTNSTIRFNLAHTSNIGLVAISSGGEIGVDVEFVRPIERDVAQAHFSVRELADLDSLNGQQWLQGFYNCWTRKEAILKAEGIGLNPPLSAFDVTLLPGAPPKLLRQLPSAQLTCQWKLTHLVPTANTVGALALSRDPSSVSCYAFVE